MFLQRVPNDVQPAGRQIDIERLGLQMEPFGRFEEAEMEPGLVDGGAAQKVKAKRGLAASRWPHGKRHRAKRKATSRQRSEEHTSELQSLMRISYAVFCLKKTNQHNQSHK